MIFHIILGVSFGLCTLLFFWFSLITAAVETAMTRVTRSSVNDELVQLHSEQSQVSQFARVKIVNRLSRVQYMITRRIAVSRACALYRVASNVIVGVMVTGIAALFLMPAWMQVLIGLACSIVAAVATILVRMRMDSAGDPLDILLDHPVCLRLVDMMIRIVAVRKIPRGDRTHDMVSDHTLEKIQLEQRKALMDRLAESQDFDAETSEMLRSVLQLSDTLTREIMVPRTDIVSLRSGESLRELMKLSSRSGFSRIPVVGDDPDDLLGVAYLKDAVRATAFNAEASDRKVESICRKPMLVPEVKPVDDLFHDMQRSRQHLAMVIDEYGGIAGLVTIEDALEQIVGELEDEHDRAQRSEPECLAEHVWRIPARTSIAELEELFEVSIDEDDVDTVYGLLTKLLGKVPIVGSTACTRGLRLTALDSVGRRKKVSSILVQQEDSKFTVDDLLNVETR